MADGETISVYCQCGKKLKAPVKAIGRSAKCPACGASIVIQAPTPPQSEETYDTVEPQTTLPPPLPANACPGCGAGVTPGAVLCVNCGYDFRSGGRFAGAVATAPAPVAPLPARGNAKSDAAADEKLPTPPWAWIFVIACGIIPVITLGGAIPGAIGFGGAGGCLAISRNGKMSAGARAGVCIAVTVACWMLFILLIGGIVMLRR